jgi:putative oxidoreductase
MQYMSLVSRILLSVLFVLGGYGKITAIAATQGYMESKGIPGILVYPTILLELGGGILIILGFQTRIVAALLAGFCVVSALIFHSDLGDQSQFILFLKNLGLAGGFLLLVQHGAGAVAIDKAIDKA